MYFSGSVEHYIYQEFNREANKRHYEREQLHFVKTEKNYIFNSIEVQNLQFFENFRPPLIDDVFYEWPRLGFIDLYAVVGGHP